jgi:drug/metabolite transporter (DMT)-like permease
MAVTCASGLELPKPGFTPAVGAALVALCVTAIAAFACYVKRLSGRWMTTFAISVVLLQYFNVLVLVAQAFKHVGPLHALAPAGNEPLVNAAQAVVLVAFIVIGVRATRRFRSVPRSSVTRTTELKDNAVDIAGGH